MPNPDLFGDTIERTKPKATVKPRKVPASTLGEIRPWACAQCAHRHSCKRKFRTRMDQIKCGDYLHHLDPRVRRSNDNQQR